MSGILTLREGHIWTVANWAFDFFKRLLAESLPPGQGEAIRKWLDEDSLSNLRYLVFDGLSDEDFGLLVVGLRKAREVMITKGPAAFADPDPSYYEGFVKALDALLRDAEVDPRRRGGPVKASSETE